ncbi:hypothetical protein GOOTI_025_00150 [Gordonia otitidis NBRC 100426]|uniref:Uncharacterized protein n=1 Tax=Gordonia otitidis (strain DSM 44809 / CCUG 52243 / JCM 12355 / NBRC 100426 / IFM 10032) TaxID=1108044 RepID=H5TGX7_GORO1|nr:hypothetical protein GOOTI_025_00150 [Gordonia otitidis NBRC 100426]
MAEATDSKPVQCEFESHRGHLKPLLSGGFFVSALATQLGRVAERVATGCPLPGFRDLSNSAEPLEGHPSVTRQYAAVIASAALTYALPLAALKLALTLGWYAP